MTMWDSSFGKSAIITWLYNQINLLWASVTGGDPPDLTDKAGSPGTFTTGNFATYNSTSNEIEDTTYNHLSFVAVEEGKGLSENDFTDEHLAIVENFEDISGIDDKMDKLEADAGTVNNILTLDSGGNAEASGKYASNIPSHFSLVIGTDPGDYYVDTIEPGVNLVRSARVIAYLGHSSDLSQNRTEEILLLLEGSETPVGAVGMSAVKGTDFDGNITWSVEGGYLRATYTVEEGNEDPTYMKLVITTL